MTADSAALPPYLSTGRLPPAKRVRLLADEAYQRFHSNAEGELPQVYPSLAAVDPDRFGICVANTQVLGDLLFGSVLSAFVGAVAMTRSSVLHSRVPGGPPAIVSFLPAYWLLVPGALGLAGVASLLGGEVSGPTTLTPTLTTMVAISVGVLVGYGTLPMGRAVADRRHNLLPPWRRTARAAPNRGARTLVGRGSERADQPKISI